MIALTHPMPSVREALLFVAFELGKKDWKLAMMSGFGVTPWLRSVASGDWRAVDRAIGHGREYLIIEVRSAGFADRPQEDAFCPGCVPYSLTGEIDFWDGDDADRRLAARHAEAFGDKPGTARGG
jgi:hypothetical protein